MMTTATAVTKPLSSARLSTTSMNPSLKSPSRKLMSPTWNVMMVEIAMETAFGSIGCVCGSECRMSSTAWPTSRESAASGATLSWRDVPRNAYTIPGIAAENWPYARVVMSNLLLASGKGAEAWGHVTHQTGDGAELGEGGGV